MKGKSQKELKEIYKEIFSQVNSFLDDIIKEEESDPINQRVIQIAKDLKKISYLLWILNIWYHNSKKDLIYLKSGKGK